MAQRRAPNGMNRCKLTTATQDDHVVCIAICCCVSIWRLSGGVVVDAVDICQGFGPKRKVRQSLSSGRLLHVPFQALPRMQLYLQGRLPKVSESGSGGFVRCFVFTE